MTVTEARAIATVLAVLGGAAEADVDAAHHAVDYLGERAGQALQLVLDIDLEAVHQVVEDTDDSYAFHRIFEAGFRRVEDVPGCERAGIT